MEAIVCGSIGGKVRIVFDDLKLRGLLLHILGKGKLYELDIMQERKQ